MSLKDIAISKEDLSKIKRKTKWNEELSKFYDQLFEDTYYDRYAQRAQAIKNCGKFALVNYYRINAVKDIRSINFCKDRFCVCCQSKLASKRENKYKPVLDEYAKDYDIYHLILTVPNCEREELPPVTDKMFSKFKYLTRFLSGNKKIKGVAFDQYGYAGLIRALEVTMNVDGTFHPHFHCMMLLKKGLELPKYRKNQFSYGSNGEFKRSFSDFEILLQKVWYLIMNDVKVTKESIQALKQGYSCVCDLVKDGNYNEVFKYVLKGLTSGEEFDLDYEDFVALERSFFNRHVIQGYGILHQITDDVGEILENEVDQKYEEEIKQLEQFETPILLNVYGGIDEILADRHCIYISKTNLRKLLLMEREEDRRCCAKKKQE